MNFSVEGTEEEGRICLWWSERKDGTASRKTTCSGFFSLRAPFPHTQKMSRGAGDKAGLQHPEKHKIVQVSSRYENVVHVCKYREEAKEKRKKSNRLEESDCIYYLLKR